MIFLNPATQKNIKHMGLKLFGTPHHALSFQREYSVDWQPEGLC